MKSKHPCQVFIEQQVSKLAEKTELLNKAFWLVETTGLKDAADIKTALDAEVRLLGNQPDKIPSLQEWAHHDASLPPLTKREANVLLRFFQENSLPEELLKKTAAKESEVMLIFANFRAQFEGKEISENEIRQILKEEKSPVRRQKVWEAAKEIGPLLAPQIIELVALRNEGARLRGYDNYFEMKCALQEVDIDHLFHDLKAFEEATENAYIRLLAEIQGLLKQELTPWAWNDLFCQGDPLEGASLDALLEGKDLISIATSFFSTMGFEVEPILSGSDLYERPGKNPHAFCMNINRGRDVRTLNNLAPTMKWMDTLLHELGHAVYELEFDKSLPWLLREPPHMIPTEAMALLCGRRAYRSAFVKEHLGEASKEAEASLKRRQLIFSRFVLVMTHFERGLYENPRQDLQRLWWSCVSKYQKIAPPAGRESHADWATKLHIGLAPVYYYSYLLGEWLASSLEMKMEALEPAAFGTWLRNSLFKPGNSYPWHELIVKCSGRPLSPHAWISQFASTGEETL